MEKAYPVSNDIIDQFTKTWNRKVRSVRTFAFIISILMLVLGVLCCIYPIESMTALEYITALAIMTAGVYEIISYAQSMVFFRMPGSLMAGVMNIIIGLLLFCSPASATISAFAYMFALLLLTFGIDKLAYCGKLRFLGITGTGWVTASGILDIIASVVFIFLPMDSTIALTYILAIYLFIGGITLFIEAVSIKDMKLANA